MTQETYVFKYYLDDMEPQQEGVVTGKDFEEALRNTGWHSAPKVVLIKLAPLSSIKTLTESSRLVTAESSWDSEGYVSPTLEQRIYRFGNVEQDSKLRYDQTSKLNLL